MDPDGSNHLVDLRGCPQGVGDDLGCTGYFLVDVELRFDFFGLMVNEDSKPSLFLPGVLR